MRFGILILPLLITSCMLGPEYKRPEIKFANKWDVETDLIQQEIPDNPADWWKKYNSPELDGLIVKALAHNTDLGASIARIEQARAGAVIAGAPLLSSADASGNISRTTYNQGRGTTPYNYNAGAGISYELDLFGRNRANAKAADERTKGSEFDNEALKLVVIADTVTAYADLLTLNDRIEIAENNLKNGQDVLKIVQARFDEGRNSALELSQQKASLASSESSLAALKEQRDAVRTQLAVLIGDAPQGFAVEGKSISTLSRPGIKVLQPSELLERRPDVKTAESDLKAANIDISAARAEFFPKLVIGLDTSLSVIGSGPTSIATGIIGSVTQPIFKGGAIAAGVDQATARKREVAENYKGTVLNAFKEAQDALSAVKAAETRYEASKTGAAESRRAYEIARIRFKEGASDFQVVLDTERALFGAEDSLKQAESNLITTSVTLFRSMGGGWKEE